MLPPVKGAVENNWDELRRIVWNEVKEQNVEHKDMMNRLERDWETGDNRVLLGAKRAPAAKKHHHTYEGGWCHHVLEMYWLWKGMRDMFPVHDSLNDDRVLRYCLHHDLHKTYRTFELVNTDPWETKYDYEQPSERMMTWNTKSLFILMQNNIRLDTLQMNALLKEGGGYTEHPGIRGDSVLAKLGYLLDELSGNVLGRIDKDEWVY